MPSRHARTRHFVHAAIIARMTGLVFRCHCIDSIFVRFSLDLDRADIVLLARLKDFTYDITVDSRAISDVDCEFRRTLSNPYGSVAPYTHGVLCILSECGGANGEEDRGSQERYLYCLPLRRARYVPRSRTR